MPAVTLHLGVFFRPGMGRRLIGSHPGHAQVGDNPVMAVQEAVQNDYSTWSVSQFAGIVSQKQLCVHPGAHSCWLVTLG